MSNSAAPIQVTSQINFVQQKVAQAAETIQDIETGLSNSYQSAKDQMGQSADLRVFEQKYANAMTALANLSRQLDDFSQRLGTIQKNYRSAQEAAIARAMMIPK